MIPSTVVNGLGLESVEDTPDSRSGPDAVGWLLGRVSSLFDLAFICLSIRTNVIFNCPAIVFLSQALLWLEG